MKSPASRPALALAAALVLVAPCWSQAVAPAASRAEKFAQLPDWTGYWVEERFGEVDVAGHPIFEGDPQDLPPEALPRLMNLHPQTPWKQAFIERFMKEELPALQERGSTIKGTGWGYPIMMEAYGAFQILVTPEEALIVNSYRDIRHIYTDGRTLPPEEELWPTPWGTSVGRWDGDTLVIETVAVQTPNVVLGSPDGIPVPLLTGKARFTERIRKTGPDRLEMQMTIEDPDALAEPWVFAVGYRRAMGQDRMFHGVFDNDRSVIDPDGDLLTISPPQR